MLDKNAKLVLKYFIKTKQPQDRFTLSCNLKLSKDETKLLNMAETAINDLLELELITIDKFSTNGKFYRLTNKGKFYFKKSFSDIFFKYIYSILLSLLSLALSLLLK